LMVGLHSGIGDRATVAVLASVLTVAALAYVVVLRQTQSTRTPKETESLTLSPPSIYLSAPANQEEFNITNSGSAPSQLVQVIYTYYDSNGTFRRVAAPFVSGDYCPSDLNAGETCVYDSLPTASAGLVGPMDLTSPYQNVRVGVVTSLGNTFWYNFTQYAIQAIGQSGFNLKACLANPLCTATFNRAGENG